VYHGLIHKRKNIFTFYAPYFDRDSSVGIAKGYGLDGRDSVPDGDKVFVLYSSASRSAVGPTQSAIHRVSGTLSPGIKRPGCDADHLQPSTAEAKNGGVITPLPNMF
jgi:hypothetical protein